MSASRHIAKHCGNFSADVLAGMIRYPREDPAGRRKAPGEPAHDRGYATREGDILLGGFLHVRCAQEAAREGGHLSDRTAAEKQELAARICREHIARHGGAGPEYFKHWRRRTERFAAHHGKSLPPRKEGEREYEYFRRLRRWTLAQSERWPRLREAVGTHLVLSPDPRVWETLRGRGLDERLFLHQALAGTMKDFGDWRRGVEGPGRSLGWMAGTHVRTDGADRHPHIHVVVLKRDEAGKEVDWSGSSIRGWRGREQEPDPFQAIKKCFSRSVERTFERCVGRSLEPSEPARQVRRPAPSPAFRELAQGLRAMARAAAIFSPPPSGGQWGNEFGHMLRIVSNLQRLREERARWGEPAQDPFAGLKAVYRKLRSVAAARAKDREMEWER